MSYEGYKEFLCERGHHLGCDCMDSDPKACRHCGGAIEWSRSVDVTNGEYPDYPGSLPGRKTLIEKEDVWQTDHYGNRFATKLFRYGPVKGDWRKVRITSARSD